MKPTLDLVLRRIHPDDELIVQQAIEQVSSAGGNIDMTHRLLMLDGSVKHIRVLAHPTRDAAGNAENVEYVGVLMDITESKQAEDALHQAQAALAHVTRLTTLGELTASIAHEVNQPLAALAAPR